MIIIDMYAMFRAAGLTRYRAACAAWRVWRRGGRPFPDGAAVKGRPS